MPEEIVVAVAIADFAAVSILALVCAVGVFEIDGGTLGFGTEAVGIELVVAAVVVVILVINVSRRVNTVDCTLRFETEFEAGVVAAAAVVGTVVVVTFEVDIVDIGERVMAKFVVVAVVGVGVIKVEAGAGVSVVGVEGLIPAKAILQQW